MDHEHPRLARPVPGPLPPTDRVRLALERLTHTQLLALAAAAVVLVGIVYLLAVRGDDGPPIETTLPMATPVASPPPDPVEIVVHAAGAVREPGLQILDAGSRVADVVASAGGFADDADIDRVNLAAVVTDAERIYVPRVGQPVPEEVETRGSGDATAIVDLNSANAADLESLPGIGPAIAAAIVDHRDESGPFANVEALLDVAGIGPAKLDGLREFVTVR